MEMGKKKTPNMFLQEKHSFFSESIKNLLELATHLVLTHQVRRDC